MPTLNKDAMNEKIPKILCHIQYGYFKEHFETKNGIKNGVASLSQL